MVERQARDLEVRGSNPSPDLNISLEFKMNVSDINCPNENDGTTMPVINDIKEWI